MKRQNDSVKRKHQDDGLLAATYKQGNLEIMQQKQKQAKKKKEPK
ncbi:small EDRK-rich factor 2-like [Marmota monax]|nr:small EDRK-rich factor 2-like [Marmota monax]